MLITDAHDLRSTNRPLLQKEAALEQRFKASDPVGRAWRMLGINMITPHKVNRVRAKMQDDRAMLSLRKRKLNDAWRGLKLVNRKTITLITSALPFTTITQSYRCKIGLEMSSNNSQKL